jgi:nucleoside-diphosphate-sugar epimerase
LARALIVGCGCRGRALGQALIEAGWLVRGSSRHREGLEAIEAAGIEPTLADPDRIATLSDQVEGVTVVFWLLGSATGDAEVVNGPRLERMLEEIVDTPVRGFVYEAAGAVGTSALATGAAAVREAGRRWRIPVEVVDADPGDHASWRAAMLAAAQRLVG